MVFGSLKIMFWNGVLQKQSVPYLLSYKLKIRSSQRDYTLG